eukprot:TRINITY_DN4709_c0_g1_i1.p1 TRINITY_DN4709_c0_g1~~TRINITY_DN4709_c0_g1_i1.p1  ORF type:complete len:287 (-),score=61.14 TRINITY_DN4709_c0_g1_i1:209-1069(-)
MGGDAAPVQRRSAQVLAATPWQVDAALFSGCTILSAASVVPVVMTVDKAVTEAAAGKSLGAAMMAGLKDMLKRPHAVVKSPAFALVMGVYTATYGANNLIDVMAERYEMTSAVQNTSKLVVATGAYTTSSILKDVAFAKMFSKAADAAKPVQRVVPMTTYGTFLFRDALIIGAGFILPQMVAGAIGSAADMDKKNADKIAQLATPCAMQLFITPIHLLGLNFYNMPSGTMAERARAVWSTCPESTGVRMFRFCWAYGVGGLVNKELAQRARDWTAKTYATPVSTQH